MDFDWGCSRFVILTKRWAIKIPNWKYGWRAILKGLLHNMNERAVSRCDQYKDKIAPVVFSDPLGFIVVMPRCEILDRQLTNKQVRELVGYDFGLAECKSDSWGWYKGRIVAVDYGD